MLVMNCSTRAVMAHYAEHGAKAFRCGDFEARFESRGESLGDYGSTRYVVTLKHVGARGCTATMYLTEGGGFDIGPKQAFVSDIHVEMPESEVKGCGEVQYR